MRGLNISIVSLVIMVSFLVPTSANGQQSLSLNLYSSTPLISTANSNDIGTEIRLTYQYHFVHIKKSLYLFGKISAFYQPKSFKGNVVYATDIAHYDRYRYGGSVGAGFYLKGNLLNADLGVDLSRNIVRLNKISNGMPPPINFNFTPAPNKISRFYSMFGVTFALSHAIIKSFLIRASISIQTSIGRHNAGEYFTPGAGLVYKF